jgi:hypothetical protein
LLAATLPVLAAAQTECPPAAQLGLGRPHIDFVTWQALPSRVLGPTNSLPGVKATALSYDAKGSRAVTVIFEFPAGWVMDRPHYLDSDQELLVLSGALEIDGTSYGPGDYAYFPAGFEHRLLRTDAGATIVNFYEGEHLAFYQPPPAGMYQPAKLIRRIETSKLHWKRARDGSRRKLLRRDRQSSEETWLVQADAVLAGRVTVHGTPRQSAAVEEMFVLEGELSTPRGVMGRGSYAWRAPHTAIGPDASRTGYTAILRSKGGPPAGVAAGEAIDVALDAPYEPCIPDALRSAIAPK